MQNGVRILQLATAAKYVLEGVYVHCYAAQVPADSGHDPARCEGLSVACPSKQRHAASTKALKLH